MRWLIDGNNVMGARPDGWWRDRDAARRRLVDQVDRWQCTGSDPVRIVFDGPDDPGLVARSRHGLAVAFSGSSERDSADDAIVAAASVEREPASITVVTSDRGLAARLPVGVQRLGAGAFRQVLDRS